ncbi:MAG: type I DNA topoisomerase [Candidatus Brocadiia bacterium]
MPRKAKAKVEQSPVRNGKSLIIVESPAKTRTISKILGHEYNVMATMGHVRDLPESSLGIDVEHDFRMKYTIIATRKKIIAELRKAANDAGLVLLAPDPDREGEAIAWHVKEALELSDEKARRITFNEITTPAVLAAVANPGNIDADRVNAQQARRILDRLVGYKISPLLWKKVARSLSAGRVQSVAVRLIVDREKEIRAFVPEEYWKLTASLSPRDKASERFEAELLRLDGENAKVTNGVQAQALRETLTASSWAVKSVETRTTFSKPGPPFSTALLQQAAANRLGFSARKTMSVAQSLYEGVELGGEGSVGLITYMRTDSFRVSSGSIESVRSYIESRWGAEYIPPKPNVYSSRKSAQEAHEAIRPTDVVRTPEDVNRFLSRDQQRLYGLIWSQFVASQMKPARYESITVDIAAANAIFRATGRRLLFDGYLKVAGSDKSDDALLPHLTAGLPLTLHDLAAKQLFTQPPPRYTEASLVKALEKEGIGRPSTYAAIISTIQERRYVKIEEKKFIPTELGELVTQKLIDYFPKIMDVSFTRTMEEHLDDIEEAKRNWLDVVREFYGPFAESLEKASKEMVSEKAKPLETGEKCPECDSPLIIRMSRFGRFVACSGYPGCKYIKREEKPLPTETAGACPECGKPLVERRGRRGPFLACSGYPECKYTRSTSGTGKARPPIENPFPDEKCPECGEPLKLRISRRGPFFGCSKYPKCKGTKALTPEQRAKMKELHDAAKAAEGAPAEAEPGNTPAPAEGQE